VAGVSVEELHSLELKFVKMLGWKLYVTSTEFEYYCEQLTLWGSRLAPNAKTLVSEVCRVSTLLSASPPGNAPTAFVRVKMQGDATVWSVPATETAVERCSRPRRLGRCGKHRKAVTRYS